MVAKVPLDQIDVVRILGDLGLDTLDRRNDDVYITCVSGRHKDKTPSLHIGYKGDQKGVFHCWSCKWRGDVYDLVMSVSGRTFPEACAFVGGGSVPDNWVPNIKTSEVKIGEYLAPLRAKFPGPVVLPGDSKMSKRCVAYLNARGVPGDVAMALGFRDWTARSRVIVPLVVCGLTVSYVARSYIGGTPKVLAPFGAPKRWEMFGLDQCDFGTGLLELSEGWCDALMIRIAGFSNSVAACASKLTEHQVALLRWARRITVWRDGDAAGLGFVKDIVSWLGRGRDIFVKDVSGIASEVSGFRVEDRSKFVHDPAVVDRWSEGTATPDPGDFVPGILSMVEAKPWADYRRTL